jgi:D-alanyl-D-alanine carboxypeptidase
MSVQRRGIHFFLKKFSFCTMTVVATCSIAVCSVQAAYAGETQRVYLNAQAAIVMDAQTHEVLYSKNADKPLYPASTTKLMTAILLTAHFAPNDLVYISADAAHQPRVRLGLKPNTTITSEQALHAILMKSANDVAYAIAQTVGGSQEGFARMMNVEARLLGCTHTNFVTPNGLHDDGHQSSAHDIAIILSEAIRNPRIVDAMQTAESSAGGRAFRNGNRMSYVKSSSFGEVIGGKTGYTSKAMYCLAMSARQHGHVRVSVVLGAPRKSFMYRETRRLLEFAYHDRKVQLV